GVPLTTFGDLYKLINDIKAGKHEELLSEMTNDDRMETLDALGTICNSIQADNNNVYEIPCKVSHIDDLINLNVDESTIPSDPIVQSMDINTNSTSYTEATENGVSLIATFIGKPVMLDLYSSFMCNESWGRSNFAQCLIEVKLEADIVDVVTIGIPSLYEDGFTKKTIGVASSPIVTTYNVVTPTVEKTNDDFQMAGKKKKMKGKSKSTNDGQFAGPSVKQNVRYKLKANTSAPKKGVTNVGNTSQSSSMLKMTGKSSKKDNLFMSNSFSALNDEEEDVENVYD
nr:zinc knuckle CX2CX4HX4C [Tanacetum cinerariifolium]